MMISISTDINYPNEQDIASPKGSAASPRGVDCFRDEDLLTTKKEEEVPSTKSYFIEAPQKFFGKYIAINLEARSSEEKEANQVLRNEFHGNLHAFFGPVLAEYLYPQEEHEKFLKEGSTLTPLQAVAIVNKGMEMMDVLTQYCELQLVDNAKKLSQPDFLDKAMIHYANDQDAEKSKQGSVTNFLSQSAKALGGGALAAFAFFTMGHLAPGDIFFLIDLLSSKKISKSIEDFITTRLVQHIESHLDSYLKEQDNSSHSLSLEEIKELRKLLTENTRSLSQESFTPSVTSCSVRATDLVMEGHAGVHTLIDAANYIFFSPLESVSAGGAHSRLFRQGVTAVIENIKSIQDSISKTSASAEELSKIKNAIDVARQKAVLAIEEDNGTWKDVPDEKSVVPPNMDGVSKKKLPFPAPWRRGI